MTESLWQGTSGETSFPKLSAQLGADVAVIGGGITGITAAMLLSKGGKRVVLLEATRVGGGTTGGSTGNLHVLPDQGLHAIREKWGRETAQELVQSRGEALDMVEGIVAEHALDCDFHRRPHYLFPVGEEQTEQILVEYEAAREAGLPAILAGTVPLPFAVNRVVKMEGQGQFHPLRFVRQLAEAISSERCRIFEDSPVLEIDEKNLVVRTAGGEVHAETIILATHTPKGFNLLQTALGPYREYGIAGRLKSGSFPAGIYWSAEEPSHSIRSFERNGETYLVAIGEKHKTGQHDNSVDYFARVEEFARARFDLGEIEYRWSAQNYRPADSLPYIGRTAASERIHVATGFGTSGLLYGPLAAAIISEGILGRPSRWEPLYRAVRFTPGKGGGTFIKENVDVAVQYVKDYLTSAERETLGDVQPGEGKVAELEGKRVAVYRDGERSWSAVSPVCTHLGCIVHWNRWEKSWDCPCHGSRFRPDGTVIEGPALKPLEKRSLRLEE